MNYSRTEAKAHARANLKGIWAAALMPFDSDLEIDEDGFRQNVRHWTQDLGIEGVFVSGKQGEFIQQEFKLFSMLVCYAVSFRDTEFTTDIEQPVLNAGQRYFDCCRQFMGKQDANGAVQFVNCADGFYAWIVFFNTRAVTDACGAVITGSRIDF